MKYVTRAALMALVAFFLALPAAAQHSVTGTVVDAADSQPLPGVNILVKGTTIGTATDMDGGYEIEAPSANDTLVFSFIGYQKQEVAIGGRSEIDVALAPQVLEGEELVVTGYQIQRKSDLTGAISLVDEEALVNTPADNPIESLQGRVPGLFVSPSGKPGDAPAVRIRGLNTLNNNSPLYVIDGVPTKSIVAQRLNPDVIESIQVLKDAASASIYGSRASNGVIVITTKRAGDETLEVNYSTDFTLSEYMNRPQVLTTRERGEVLFQAAVNDDADPSVVPIYDYDWTVGKNGEMVLNEVSWPEYLGDPSLGIRTANTNWYDEISRTGIVQQHNLSVASGSERGGALLALRYHGNEAILKEQDFRSVSARINSHYNFFDERLRVGENFTLIHSSSTPMPFGLGGNPLWNSILVQPIIPVYTEDGEFAGPVGEGFDDRDNPVRLIEDNTWDRDERLNVFGNVFADVKLTDRLSFNTRLAGDWSNFDHRNIQVKYATGILSRDFNSLFLNNEESFNWTANSTLNYVVDTERHMIDVLAGVEASEFDVTNAAVYRRDFAIESLEFFVPDAGTGVQTVSGGGTGNSLLSYFGKANYVYDDRYLAAVTLRYDGSSRFGADRRFGFFPSVSAAWRVSNEAFMRNVSAVSDLKLRAGWGRTGNQEIGDAAALQLFIPNYGDDDTWGPSGGTAYALDGQDTGNLPAGFIRIQRANPLLQWEETSELNVGADFGFFNQRLTGSLDVFNRVTEDILIQPAYIAVVGEGGASWGNAATVETKGAELGLAFNDYDGEFTYRIHGNVGYADDEITSLPEEVVRSYPGNLERTILGQSQFAMFGYVADGIFQNQEEVEAHADQTGKGVGRLRLKDLNEDGVIDNLDQKYLGDPVPDFDFGLGGRFNYKGFDLNVFLQGVAGVQIDNGLKTLTDFVGRNPNTNYGRRVLDAWTPENADSDIPAVSLKNHWGELQMSSYYVENGAYLKLREVTLGYTLPQKFTQRFASDRTRLYLRGGNLLTFTDSSGDDMFTGTDPEFPNNAFPAPRTVTLGVQVAF